MDTNTIHKLRNNLALQICGLYKVLRCMPPGRHRSAIETELEKLRKRHKRLGEQLAGGAR